LVKRSRVYACQAVYLYSRRGEEGGTLCIWRSGG
jgi:hypothetical protein